MKLRRRIDDRVDGNGQCSKDSLETPPALRSRQVGVKDDDEIEIRVTIGLATRPRTEDDGTLRPCRAKGWCGEASQFFERARSWAA